MSGPPGPPARRLLLGTRAGCVALHLTDDGWDAGSVLWRDKSIAAIAVDPVFPDRIHVSVYDDGVYRSEDGGRTWERYFSGELHSLAVRPEHPELVLAGGEPPVVYRSTDRGGLWAPGRMAEALHERGSREAWRRVRSLAFDPTEVGVVYAGVEGGGILTSTDGGDEWFELAARGLPDDVHYLLVRRGSPDVLLAATGEGVFRSVDRGYYWTSASAGLPDLYVLALHEQAVDEIDGGGALIAAAHPGRLEDWWDAAQPARLYRLTEGAARWWPVTEPLSGAVYGLAEDAAGNMYAGTTGGQVLWSRDAGAIWESLADGFPPIRALALA